MIYRQPVEAVETANAALSGNLGVLRGKGLMLSGGQPDVPVSPIKAVMWSKSIMTHC